MWTVVIRTLKREFRLQARSEASAAEFAFMAIAPEIAGVALFPVDLPLETTHGFYRIWLPGGGFAEGSAEHLLSVLHRLILNDVMQTEPGAPMLHGATLAGPMGRILLAGIKADGKTTLALHLLAHGWAVEGDEHLLIREGAVVARPRTMRVKAGSIEHVPLLADAVLRAPSIMDWDGSRIYAFDPSVVGRPWSIACGRLDYLVFAEANHGGRSLARVVATEESFARLVRNAILPTTGIAGAIARLRLLASSVPAIRLSIGDLAGAEWHLRHIGELTAPGATST